MSARYTECGKRRKDRIGGGEGTRRKRTWLKLRILAEVV